MALFESFKNIAIESQQGLLSSESPKSPPVEPENQWMVAIMNGAEKQTWTWIKSRKTPNQWIKEYFWKTGETTTKMDQYSFMVALYKNQISCIDTKIKQCEARKARFKAQCDIEIKKYTDEIKTIEDWIKKREEEYLGMINKDKSIRDQYNLLKKEYDGLIHKDSILARKEAEKTLRKMDELLKTKSNLPNHEEYVYSCTVRNITLPNSPVVFYSDVRLLIREYEKFVDNYEDQIEKNDDKEDDLIEALEDRKELNEEQLEKALEMFNWYYDVVEK